MARDDRDQRGGHRRTGRLCPPPCGWCERSRRGKHDPANRTRRKRLWRKQNPPTDD